MPAKVPGRSGVSECGVQGSCLSFPPQLKRERKRLFLSRVSRCLFSNTAKYAQNTNDYNDNTLAYYLNAYFDVTGSNGRNGELLCVGEDSPVGSDPQQNDRTTQSY
jgi:hypothetical protein